ncbi:MAG: glutathione S-transferase family protein [Pseudomonadales bacterium]|nr:glutathione S-transferase family protein [Pseudomonadales bacterium]
MLKVIEHPLSPYAQKVKLALHYKNLEFETETPAIGTDTEAFNLSSPRGEVPVFQHDGLMLYDSAIIGGYIEEQWPEQPLFPQTPVDRANARLIEDAMDTHFEGNTWGLGEVHVFGRAQGARAKQMTTYAVEQIQGWYRWLDSKLDADWFNGDAYGYADLCVLPFVNGAGRFDMLPQQGSKLSIWLARINERDDVKIVTSQARAAELDPETMQSAVASGFKREYRDHRLEWMIRAGGIDIVAKGIEQDNIRFNENFH